MTHERVGLLASLASAPFLAFATAAEAFSYTTASRDASCYLFFRRCLHITYIHGMQSNTADDAAYAYF